MSSLSKNHLGRQGHDHANTIKSNKEKLRPQPEVTTHYQAHPYNLNINSFPGRANPGGHHVELPTTEEPSGSSIGIGSMPGSNFEAGVATLPEEREGGKPYGTFRTGFEDYSPAKGGLHPKLSKGEGHDGNSVYKDTLADHHLVRELGHDHLATSKWEIPSTEVPSGSRQGVGSLPGNPGEAGVAILPEERKVQENPPRRSFSHRMPLPAAAHDQQEADVVPADHVLKHEAEEKKGLETGGITGGIPHRSYSSFLDLGDGNQDKATAQTGSGSSTTRSPVLHSNVTSDVLESLGWDVDALSLEDRFPEPRDPRERVLEERLMRVEAAQKLAEVDRRTESERVEKEMNHGATADRMAKGLNEVVVEFEGKAKELYHGAEGTIFGILHPEEQRRQAALAKLDKGELAKLQAGNWERFEAQERRRLETDMRAMVEDEPSRKNSVSSSSRSESSITIFNADRKLRLPTPAPDTHLGKSTVLESTSLDSSESQQPPQSEDKNKLEVRRAQLLAELKENMALSLSQAVKEFEEQASKLYESGGLVDHAKGIEERATGLLNRAEEGISGFMNRRHLKEEAGQRRSGLALSHVDVQARDKGESMLSNAEVLTGVISDTNNRASNAFAVMIESEATDGAGGASAGLGPFPIANHQDEMKSVVSKPDSNAQVPPFSSSHTPTSTSTTTSSANSMGRLEHGDSPPQNPAVRLFVTNPSDDSLIDDCTYEDQRGHSSIPGPIGTSYVPPGVQSEYYKEAKSVAVGDANAGGQEAETNVMGTPAPSHTIYGVGGVSFTMDTEDGRLPGYPTPAGMSQLIGDRIQADIKRNAAQAAMEDNDSLKALQLPVLSHIESNTSMEAVKGSPTVSSSSVSKEASSMGISPRDHGPPVSTIFEAVPAKSKGIN